MQTRVERLPLELTPLESECELLVLCEGFFLTDNGGERRPGREQDTEKRERHPAVDAVPVRPERRRTIWRGHDVNEDCRHGHADAYRNDLQRPSLSPARQRSRPDFEK